LRALTPLANPLTCVITDGTGSSHSAANSRTEVRLAEAAKIGTLDDRGRGIPVGDARGGPMGGRIPLRIDRVLAAWRDSWDMSEGGRILVIVTSAVGSEFVVAGPFEAWIRVDGDEIRGGRAHLSLDLLRRCEPVRRSGAHRRQRHLPGLWFSTTAGRFLEYESLLSATRCCCWT
jgi:hypothetical protein